MSHLNSFTSQQILFLILGLVIVVLLLIFALKWYLRNLSNENLKERFKDFVWASPLTARNKYPLVNPFLWHSNLFYFSIILSLILTYSFINWTTYEIKETSYIQDEFLNVDIEMAIPRSADAPPPPPPPPPMPVIQEVPDNLVLEEDEITFLDQSIVASSSVEIFKPEKTNFAPPPPPPMSQREDDVKEIFMIVEDMPRFPGCENQPTKELKKTCSEQQMISYIYNNIKFPATAVENGISGNVIVQFVVNADGSIVDSKVLRDIGGGCGEEAIRVVELMNSMPEKWIPGKQRGRPVRVVFTLPIRFKLQLN